ncbi:MAG: hypothetical protein ABSB22_19525 [Thermodesulfobacteriota bacterium]
MNFIDHQKGGNGYGYKKDEHYHLDEEGDGNEMDFNHNFNFVVGVCGSGCSRNRILGGARRDQAVGLGKVRWGTIGQRCRGARARLGYGGERKL